MKYNKRANHFLWGLLALEAALLLLVACLVAPTPPVLAQDDESAVMYAIENAMPKLSELPTGWTWFLAEEEPGVGWHTAGTEKRFLSIWGSELKIEQCVNSRPDISCDIYYDSSAHYGPSPEAFRSAIMTEGDKPYEGLPGGLIFIERGTGVSNCDINFWKSPNCWGKVTVGYQAWYFAKTDCPTDEAYLEARAEQAEAFVVSTCEELAQLIWSRLPEGEGEPGTGTATLPPVTTGSSTGQIPPTTTGTPAVPPEDEEEGQIPDAALPIATGAAAGLAALCALATALAQGIPPGEAISELTRLFQGKVPQAEDIESQQAWEDFRTEQAKYEYSSADYSGDQMAKVKAEMAAEAAGTITDFDKMRLKLWIADKAPSDQAYDDMMKLVDKMTLKTGDGKVIGDVDEICKALGQELQRTEQPHLTYNEEYALRDEVMEEAPVLGHKREIYSDGTGTIEAIADIKKIEGTTRKITKGADTIGKISDGIKYVEGYVAAGNSTAMAITKAVTQMGVKMFVTNNPVISLGDTTLKYIGQATIGKDISPSKGTEIIINKAFDSITGELDKKPIEALDFGSSEIQKMVYTSQINGIQEQMKNPNLTASERETLSQLLSQLQTKQQEM
jgi:hypothetical protein